RRSAQLDRHDRRHWQRPRHSHRTPGTARPRLWRVGSGRDKMSIYTVNRMCHLLMHDKNFRHRMQPVPAEVVAGLDLTDAERDLILRGEVGRLYLLGANAFLL